MIKERMNKKAQGLSVNAIILIVLGVIILVMLIVGFTIGWKKILPFLSQDKVDTIAQQCEIACSTSSVYDYCQKQRTVTISGADTPGSCHVLDKDKEVGAFVASCPTLASQCVEIQEETKTETETGDGDGDGDREE